MTPEDKEVEQALDPYLHYGSGGLESAPECALPPPHLYDTLTSGIGRVCPVCHYWWAQLSSDKQTAALENCGAQKQLWSYDT